MKNKNKPPKLTLQMKTQVGCLFKNSLLLFGIFPVKKRNKGNRNNRTENEKEKGYFLWQIFSLSYNFFAAEQQIPRYLDLLYLV